MKTYSSDSTLAPSKLLTHDQSHIISKPKPKIRIIHIVAPEIIKTDAEHFRELVQKLTGKSSKRKEKKNKIISSSQVLHPKTCSKQNKTMESGSVAMLQNMHGMKKENEEIYEGGNSNPNLNLNPNPFLSFFGEVDGFIHDMNEYPLLPFRSSQVNAFGEMPLC